MNDIKLYEKIKKDFVSEFEACQDEREQCVSDRRFAFIRGAQWDEDLSRQFQNRPRLEVNKVQISCLKIFNEYLKTQIDTTFIPRNEKTSDDLADMCTSIMRGDMQDSNANLVFQDAFWDMISGGMCAWRLSNEYCDDEDEDDDSQKICFELINDADISVFFLNSIKADKSDATACVVLKTISHEEYQEQFGDDSPSDWSPQIWVQNGFDWVTKDSVTIAEYYLKEKQLQKITSFVNGAGDVQKLKLFKNADAEETSEFNQAKKDLMQSGYKIEKTRNIKTTRVHKYIIDGTKIIEDCGYIAGSEIPIVVGFGKRTVVEKIERIQGHVRLARDAQVIKNIQLSSLVDASSRSSVSVPIMVAEQIAGYEQMWANQNVERKPLLLVSREYDVNGNAMPIEINYTKPPEIPPATVGLIQTAEQDMQDILGNPQQANQVAGNASGIAVELVQSRLDTLTYNYISNMAIAMRRSAEIWLSMAKDVYIEDSRVLKGRDKEENISYHKINEPMLDDSSFEILKNNISSAKLDIQTTIGASSQVKRQATVRSLSEILNKVTDQQTAGIINSLILMNLEGEGLTDVRSYFRKQLVQSGVITPTLEEKQEMEESSANAQPSQQDQFLQAQTDLTQTQAQKNLADIELKQTQVAETQASALEKLAQIKDMNYNNIVNEVLNNINAQNAVETQPIAENLQ